MLEHSVHSTILSVVLGSSQASQDVIAALVLLLGWSSLSSLSDNRLLGVVVVVDVDSCWVFSIGQLTPQDSGSEGIKRGELEAFIDQGGGSDKKVLN
jgi:hypothetical protein